MSMAMSLALLWPDTHIPYHDIRAVELVMEVGRLYKKQLRAIYFLGDIGELLGPSSHAKHPAMSGTLVVEDVDAITKFLDTIDKEFPGVRKHYIVGNHEHRFERYIINVAPAMFGVTELKFLLGIHERPLWTWYDYKPDQAVRVMGTSLIARHEPLGSSAKASVSRAACSMVHGHTHRIDEHTIIGLDGRRHIHFSPGWLGSLRHDKVFNYVKNPHQWELGFDMLWVDDRTKVWVHQPVRIMSTNHQRWCVIDGKKIIV